LVDPTNILLPRLSSLITASGLTTHTFTSESELESQIRSISYKYGQQICFAIVISKATVGGQY
jgi:hypothetical protein